MKIKVIDECMGTGKSTYILDQMNKWYEEDEERQIVYLSPMRSEVGDPDNNILGRVSESCPDLNFKLPKTKGAKNKSDHLKELLGTTYNIACTHNLFCKLTVQEIDSIKESNNILVIDEALETVDIYEGVNYQDIVIFVSGGQVKVDEDSGRISWDHLRHPVDKGNLLDGNFHNAEFIQMCDAGYLYLLGDKVVMWEYPAELLEAFDEVYVMTYLFEGSLFYYWCTYHGIEFEYLKDIPLVSSTKEVKELAKKLITVLDFKSMDKISKYKYSYSGWMNKTRKNASAMKNIGSVLTDLHRNKTRGLSKDDMIFTSPKVIAEVLSKKGEALYNIDWLESDCKATNYYADKRCMIYLYDKFMNPLYENYFSKRDITVNKDLFALNSLIQWVYRGCVRKGEPMLVFIASSRMRKLLEDWLYE